MSWNWNPSSRSSSLQSTPLGNPSDSSKNGISSSNQIKNSAFPSDDYDSDDEEEEEEGGGRGKDRASVDDLESSIFQAYGGDYAGVLQPQQPFRSLQAASKVRDLLVASRMGAISCLICLEKVRVYDPIWDCKMGCHAIYHLICIQAWATEACKVATERAGARLSQEHFPAVAEQAAWHCPKCRVEYARAEIPRESKCFCGKVIDPPIDLWLTAHSCGQICGRLLSDGCGHDCKLLCHPGPCPPCPQMINAKCYCGAGSSVRRCGHKEFSCGRTCGKGLACKIHNCEHPCHPGECPPCKRSGLHSCHCNRLNEIRNCADFNFLCDQPCGKPLQCKRHLCEKVCHSGQCGECELQGRQRCPCGRVEYKDMACDAVAPTCGSTCEKWLSCSRHRCQERCHTGSCRSVCRVVTLKVCRCGSLRKEAPCHQDLQCERKCQRLRDCKRHPCKRRCCSGDCPPCSEICGRKLRCGNHKCPAPCHRGPCAPCPLSVRISCACGSTAYEVPCGAEKDKKPPRCSKPCPIIPLCKHGVRPKPHRCHYGACPPCDLVCTKELNCDHLCKQRCHGPRAPPNTQFSLVQRKKQKALQPITQDLGSPCPPCPEHIFKECLGHHVGGERTMICAESYAFSCGRPCGNPLACGNHTCQLPCHEVTVPRKSSEGVKVETVGEKTDHADTCEPCTLICQKKRVPMCPHPCTRTCHPKDCPPCTTLIKRPCYCGTLVHVFPCNDFNSLCEEERAKKLSCGGPCHRKLQNCTHLCPDICHPGPCKTASNCRKKVTVRCACLRLKKDWHCSDVQASCDFSKPQYPRGPSGVGLLACDKECIRLAQECKLEEETMQQYQLHQRKAAALEDMPADKLPKRRRRRVANSDEEHSKFKEIITKVRRWAFWLIAVLLILLVMYFGIHGLQLLSNWMNERDARQPSRKQPHGTYSRP